MSCCCEGTGGLDVTKAGYEQGVGGGGGGGRGELTLRISDHGAVGVKGVSGWL